jgi:hypothetical protein
MTGLGESSPEKCIQFNRSLTIGEAAMIEWLQNQDASFWWLTGTSVLFFLAMIIIAPVMAVRVPADYFAKGKRHKELGSGLPAGMRPIVKIGKNVLGAVLVVAGVAMLVLPGQGVFAVLIGLMLMDIPGKRKLVRWIVSRPSVLRSINKLRHRYHRPPLVGLGA